MCGRYRHDDTGGRLRARCAARPEAIIDGIVTALGILEEKRTAMATGALQQHPAPPPPETRRRCMNDSRPEQSTIPIGMDELVIRTATDEEGRLPARPDRLREVGDDFEINYTFDKDFVLKNLRIT